MSSGCARSSPRTPPTSSSDGEGRRREPSHRRSWPRLPRCSSQQRSSARSGSRWSRGRSTRRWRCVSIVRRSSFLRRAGRSSTATASRSRSGRLTTTVYANPRQVDDARDLTLAAGKQFGLDPAVLYPTLVDRSQGLRLRRAQGGSAQGEDPAGDWTSPALGFYPEELRFYPQGPVAAQVIGYAGLDNKGLEGLERSLEGTLAGQAGQPDDRQGPVRPRARRRRDEAGDARATAFA